MKTKTKTDRHWFEFRNAAGADDGHELLIMDEIGGWGVSAGEFVRALAKVPKGKPLTVGISSPGGDVFSGMTVYNALQRRGNVNTRIDGLAASIASVIAMAGDTVSAPANAMIMIHDPVGYTAGDAKDHSKTADTLIKIRDQIAGIYVDKTGLDYDAVVAAMAEESWYNALEAESLGYVDEVTAQPWGGQIANSFDLSKFRNAPASAGVASGKNKADEPPAAEKETRMKTLIKALAELGIVPVGEDNEEALTKALRAWYETNTEALQAADKNVEEARERIAALDNTMAADRRARAEEAVKAARADGRLENDKVAAKWTDMLAQADDDQRAVAWDLFSAIKPPAAGADPLPFPGGSTDEGGDILARFESMSDSDPAKDKFLRDHDQQLLDAFRAKERTQFIAARA